MIVLSSNTSKLTHTQISDFVRQQYAEIQNSKDIADLVHFHSINKFLLMAHDQNRMVMLGNLIANHSRLPTSVVFQNYASHLELTLQKEPTIKSHYNVLQKIFGYFKKDLSLNEKTSLLQMMNNYKSGDESLGSVLLALEELTRKFQKTYLVRQTYFLLYVEIKSA
ncbi:MAG: DUF1722 domain-containing protein [Nitrososphaeria archaeon]|nr:DUF1722 domain-containing protein [Nitrososphaeria archaeon]NDF25500.1 DUF1722 domain-containing protein [Nitrososphaerota archaeon]